jgi:hypothetical protein
VAPLRHEDLVKIDTFYSEQISNVGEEVAFDKEIACEFIAEMG